MISQEYDGYRTYSCDICTSSEAREVPHVRKYTGGQLIHICNNCGFVYVRERRSSTTIADVWSNALFGDVYTSATPLFRSRHIYVAEFLDQEIGLKDRLVLDVGAGEGNFLSVVRDLYGARVFGVEPSEANCKILQSLEIDHFCGTLEEFANSRPTIRPQVATMMWTLENTVNPRSVLQHCHSILDDHSHILVATGSRIMVPFSKLLNLYLSQSPVDVHPSRFSRNSLENILRVSGFDPRFNRYAGDTLLLGLGRKLENATDPELAIDSPEQVEEFFEKWHQMTEWFQSLEG